jgi:hypothetical protein
VVLATLMSDSATGFGLTAAAIAVCGFVAHARPAFSGADEERLRRATTAGGVFGLGVAVLVIVLSALLKVMA